MYNELSLFRDIYLKNNAIDDVKYFKTYDNIIYEVLSTGEEVALSQLYNTLGQGKIKLLNTNDYTITISTEDYVYEFNNEGDIVETKNTNSKYSKEILKLYDELVISSERYISKTTISDELYFEFKDGVINQVDKYGNITQDNNMVLNPNSVGSGELRINSSNQVAIVIYDTDEDIKVDYGSTELYSEPLRYSRDGVTLVKNLARLELVAEAYSGNRGLTSDWLTLYYLRKLRYDNSLMYDIVTGATENFITYVDQPQSSLRTYFTSRTNFVVNGHSIDLHHLAASFAGILYDTPTIYHILYEELEYDCVVSWAGDLHTFMEKSILRSGVKEQYGNYSNATYSLMGKANTTFEMEDVYADIDAWLLYYNLIENPNLSLADIFDKFYSGESARSYKNRYTSFISVMDDIATQFNSSKTNFEGVVAHFTNTDKGWQTIESLEITPTEEEELEIADGFIRWIKDQAAKE